MAEAVVAGSEAAAAAASVAVAAASMEALETSVAESVVRPRLTVRKCHREDSVAAVLDAAHKGLAGKDLGTVDSVARDSVARDSVARDSVARDSVVRDSAARDSAVRDSAVRDSARGRPFRMLDLVSATAEPGWIDFKDSVARD